MPHSSVGCTASNILLPFKSPELPNAIVLDLRFSRVLSSQRFQLIPLPRQMALCILFLTLLSLFCKIDAVSQQGRVGLWSDSECNSKSTATSNFGEQDPIALNFTLLPDSCGVPGATVHSYRVLQKAICANGSTATFSYYNSNNCTADPTDENPNPGLVKRIKNRRQSVLDGECLALIAFNSLAFICEGVTPHNFKVNSLSTSIVAPTSTSSSTVPLGSSTFTSTSFSNQSATAKNSSARSSPTGANLGSKPGLPAGTSAGVGVGSAIGVLAIAALCFFLFRRHSIAKPRHGTNPGMMSLIDRDVVLGVGPLSVYEAGVGQPHEIGGVGLNTVHEAGTDHEVHEIASPRTNPGSEAGG